MTTLCDNQQGARADLQDGGPILAAALDYRRRGWSIIPIAAGTKKPPRKFRSKQYQKRLPTEDGLWEWLVTA